jgi:hypothetical protein
VARPRFSVGNLVMIPRGSGPRLPVGWHGSHLRALLAIATHLLALSDADNLEALKTARDAIVAGIAAGRLTVMYMIRGRQHQTEASTDALRRIEELIQTYERKAARATNKTFRLARLQRPRLSE